MSILFLNWRDLENPDAGGAEVYTHEIASRLARRGHRVSLFTSRFRGAQEKSEAKGVSVIRRGGKLSVYREAARFLHSHKFDVVVDEINTRPFFAHKHAREARVVALIHQLAREFWFYETPLPIALLGRFALEPMWLRQYRGITTVTVSEHTRQDLLQLRFKSVRVVHNGVDVPAVKMPEREDQPTLVFVGRLKRAKKPADALLAYRALRKRLPSARLWMLGDGPLMPKIERMARRLDGACKIWGRVSEVAKWDLLGRAHLLLVPAIREGWGRVVLEANAVGTPAVGYDVPGIREAIRHRETGLLSSARTPQALAEAAATVLLDPESYKSMARSARSWAASFDWEKSAGEFESVLVDAQG